MGLNKNHEVEEFNGIRCAVVEKGIPKERVDFLRNLLEFNHYKVEIAASAPPKEKAAVAAAVTVQAEENKETPNSTLTEALPETFNIGVADLMFNSINAVFGRLLKSPDGHIVTLAYWNQKEKVSDDEVPYYEHH